MELFPGQTSTITLTNDKRPNLYIHKSDADTGAPIAGAVYLVKGADGHSIAEVETDENGVAVVENLLPGVVEVIENRCRSLICLPRNPRWRRCPNRDRDVYFENYKRPVIEIIKENEITHDPIANVPFRVWYASNNTSTGEYKRLGVYYTDEEAGSCSPIRIFLCAMAGSGCRKSSQPPASRWLTRIPGGLYRRRRGAYLSALPTGP